MSADIAQSAPYERSQESLAFEALWRDLPRAGLAPHRRDFKPERVRRMLANISLMEMRLEGKASFPIKLIGSAVQERMQSNLAGRDYLEFLPGQYHAGMIESARCITNRPCGLWQVTAFHYARGFSLNWELTMFPLLSDDDQPTLLLIHSAQRDDLIAPLPSAQEMAADTASAFRFIDIGAGEPQWLAA